MGIVDSLLGRFGFRASGGGNSFDAAGRGKRLRNWYPSRAHINAAIEAAGPTLVARARWLYENDGYAGNAVDEWVSAAIGDGIKPRPRLTNKAKRKELLKLFLEWTDEADAEGRTDFFGLQAMAAREAYLAGECFIRMRTRRPGDMQTVPFQLQVYPSEMLDVTFTRDLGNGSHIRAGIEFNAIGQRAAYHFFRSNPNDYAPGLRASTTERVRVPASDVIHVYDGRQGSQIRGVPRVARVLVRLFGLEEYDDAEIERKKTAALFAGFLVGKGEAPIQINDDGASPGQGGATDTIEDAPIAGMSPGAMIDLGDDRDIKFSTPTEVGGSYEAFQYRTLLKVCAGLGIPYAVVTGDVAKGNFSNVRTAIIGFRRRVSQWQNHTLVFQFCRPVWARFIQTAVLAGKIDLPGYDENPALYALADWLPPRAEWIDPLKDVKAEAEAVAAGFKSRTQVIAERGYDREDVDAERAEERADDERLGLNTAPIGHNGVPPLTPDDDAAGEDDEDGEEARGKPDVE